MSLTSMIILYILTNMVQLKQSIIIFILLKQDLIKKIITIKFLVCSSFLLLMRGGTPRYRYDYLTKIG